MGPGIACLEELQALAGARQREQVRSPRRCRRRVAHCCVHRVTGGQQPLDDAAGDVACRSGHQENFISCCMGKRHAGRSTSCLQDGAASMLIAPCKSLAHLWLQSHISELDLHSSHDRTVAFAALGPLLGLVRRGCVSQPSTETRLGHADEQVRDSKEDAMLRDWKKQRASSLCRPRHGIGGTCEQRLLNAPASSDMSNSWRDLQIGWRAACTSSGNA